MVVRSHHRSSYRPRNRTMTTYSPKTLEMVAEKAYEAMFPKVHKINPPSENIQEVLIQLARWHLDEIGGVLANETARQEHAYRKAVGRVIGSKPCPHCK